MSFNLVTTVWLIKILFLYTVMILAVPYLVMRRYLQGRTTAQKFVICTVAGNFFYITMVLAWGLLHTTNRWVLISTTLVLPVWMLIRRRDAIKDGLRPAWQYAVRFIFGECSFRFCAVKLLRWIRRKAGAALAPAARHLRANLPEWLLFMGCSVFTLWFFSITDHFGPRASDLVVHMLWINEVDAGVVFCDGIYPFGMHAMLYYLHAIFDIPTVRLVLSFGTVQAVYIFLMLLAFLKEVCRFRYTPYLTYLVWLVGDFLRPDRYGRYYAALPQEFAMVFLLPCAVAIILFFRSAKAERGQVRPLRMRRTPLHRLRDAVSGKKLEIRDSTLWLWVLILSFGLTLSVHFYITILAVFLVAAVAVAYLPDVVRWSNFRRLIVAAVLSVAIAVAPMAIAFAGGTPLQGSLYWAIGIMQGETTDETAENSPQGGQSAPTSDTAQAVRTMQATQTVRTMQATQNVRTMPAAQTMRTVQNALGEAAALDTAPDEPSAVNAVWLAASELWETVWHTTLYCLEEYVAESPEYIPVWVGCMVALAAQIPLLWLLREWEQAQYRILVLAYHALLIFMFISEAFGLPALMQRDRATLFFSYTALCCISLAADGILILLFRSGRVQTVGNAVSLLLAAALLTSMVGTGHVREKGSTESSLQKDGAALCTFDIMEQYPDQKWTIVSCNEERSMIAPVSWHYETIEFLYAMEDYHEGAEMYIPTQYVFFFVEKNVLDYSNAPEFEDGFGFVSEDWASAPLPRRDTVSLMHYKTGNRIIVNSRMYYWAQEYMRRFPNEMKVYYEDEDFVCYFIEQNEYYLNNFAIDYGYNSGR